eukprot:scaffold172141_cov13-Tisochrysis_lutea.AAC.1
MRSTLPPLVNYPLTLCHIDVVDISNGSQRFQRHQGKADGTKLDTVANAITDLQHAGCSSHG